MNVARPLSGLPPISISAFAGDDGKSREPNAVVGSWLIGRPDASDSWNNRRFLPREGHRPSAREAMAMRHLRSIGLVSAALVGIGAAGASAAPLSPSAASVSAESQIRKVEYRHYYRGGHYYRQEYYGSPNYSYGPRGYYGSRDYIYVSPGDYGSRDYAPAYYYGPRHYGGNYRSYYDYYDPPYVYGGVGERFVILGSGRDYYPRHHRGYLRHW